MFELGACTAVKYLLSVGCLILSCPAFGQNPSAQSPAQSSMTIRDITFENTIRLSPQKQNGVAEEVRKIAASASPADLDATILADDAEELFREAYQDEGYFKPTLFARARKVPMNPSTIDLELVVKDEGQQYWLRDLHWKGMTVFSEEQLLNATPIHPGEILDRSKIAAGLEAVKKLYASSGYINFTCMPNLVIDEAGSKISLTIDVDEGRQFRMGHLFVEGLDPAKAASVVRGWPLRSGDVYLDSAVNEFFLHVGAIAKPISSSRHVDEKNGRVDIELRF